MKRVEHRQMGLKRQQPAAIRPSQMAAALQMNGHVHGDAIASHHGVPLHRGNTLPAHVSSQSRPHGPVTTHIAPSQQNSYARYEYDYDYERAQDREHGRMPRSQAQRTPSTPPFMATLPAHDDEYGEGDREWERDRPRAKPSYARPSSNGADTGSGSSRNSRNSPRTQHASGAEEMDLDAHTDTDEESRVLKAMWTQNCWMR